MQRPPPKPKGPDDLAEVERALSVLQGRNPEFERARREDEETRAKRRAAIDAESRVETRKARLRVVRFAGIAIAVAGFAVFAGSVFRKEVARRGRIEQASDSYRSMGFVVVETSGRGSPGRLEDTPDKGCLLAVSTDGAPIEVARGTGTVKGPGPVLFCTCATEKVTVTSQVAEGGGLSLLRIDAAALGGSKAFAFLPFEPATAARTDEACSDASLDAWIEGKRYPAQAPPDDAWLKADAKRGALLEGLGFKPFATVPADRPFAIVELPKESCVVAIGAPGEKLGLRMKGGAMAVANAEGAFAWCAPGEATATIEREGTSAVTVLAAPAGRVGGTVGLGEVLAKAGVTIAPASVAVPPGDRAWNAKQLLLASAVPDGLVTTASAPAIPADVEARLAAVSLGSAKALAPEPAAEVYSFCEPPLADDSTDAMCVFSGPHAWKIANAEAVGGVARAKMPFWLFALDGVSEPAAMKVAADLVTFARRMKREGFEPTTIEAMTETPTGVEVLGRMGEDAIVALGLAPAPPWVFPYTDGPAWSLTEGEPRVVPVKPLEKVKVNATAKKLPSKDTRRSVVFRRQARPG